MVLAAAPSDSAKVTSTGAPLIRNGVLYVMRAVTLRPGLSRATPPMSNSSTLSRSLMCANWWTMFGVSFVDGFVI